MRTRRLAVMVVLGVAATWAAASCTKTNATSHCSASNCSGCCAVDGACLSGQDAGACGAHGGSCEVCEGDQACVQGVCELIQGCIANGAACTASADCCSASCTAAGRCAVPAMGSSGTTSTSTTHATTTSSGSGATTTSTSGATGTLSCAAPASYNTGNGSACGSFRWNVKTGTDSNAASISLVPTLTTIGQLDAIPAPSGVNNGPTTRYAGAEGTLYMLKNVTLIETKLEPDSDYHMPVTDGTASMETEIPFPGCVGGQSPWGCEVTHARAALEKVLTPSGSYQHVNQTVTIVGVGFFDLLHGSASQAPNGIELHPVLAMCFGTDCDPFAN